MKFLTNEPALVLEKEKTLVIGDVHVGYDRELYEAGFRFAKMTEKLAGKIKRLFNENDCEKLAILGDAKHAITLRPDLLETKRFFKLLQDFAEVTLFQGNHDGALQNYLDCKVVPGQGAAVGKCYLLHGHAAPKKAAFKSDLVIMSHLHPVVEFHDVLGGVITERVWAKTDGLVVLPAFNELLGGVDLRESSLGPLSKSFEKDELDLYLLDGLHLGKVKNLPPLERPRKDWSWEEL